MPNASVMTAATVKASEVRSPRTATRKSLSSCSILSPLGIALSSGSENKRRSHLVRRRYVLLLQELLDQVQHEAWVAFEYGMTASRHNGQFTVWQQVINLDEMLHFGVHVLVPGGNQGRDLDGLDLLFRNVPICGLRLAHGNYQPVPRRSIGINPVAARYKLRGQAFF